MKAFRPVCSIVIALLLIPAALFAARRPIRPVAEQTKIDFLLGEVRSSPAIFVRNGSEYPGRSAASHLLSKLNFAGKRVQNARQFITGIASHSEASGKPYEIRWPDGRREALAEWLLERLAIYEREHLPAPETTPLR
ncbi:MAG TPA: DUF5329 family protein [Thermoanaerobaculia bacterium]